MTTKELIALFKSIDLLNNKFDMIDRKLAILSEKLDKVNNITNNYHTYYTREPLFPIVGPPYPIRWSNKEEPILQQPITVSSTNVKYNNSTPYNLTDYSRDFLK